MTRLLLAAVIATCIPATATADTRLDKVVMFDYNQTRVRSAGRATLATIARVWKANPVKITIEGHGYALEEEASIELGFRRAERVRAQLIKQGVDANMIETIGHSRGEPGRYVDIVFAPAK